MFCILHYTFSAAKVLLFFEIRKSFVFFLSNFYIFTVIQYVKGRFFCDSAGNQSRRADLFTI